MAHIKAVHTCTLNPIGVDPTPEWWKEMSAILRLRMCVRHTQTKDVPLEMLLPVVPQDSVTEMEVLEQTMLEYQ